MGCLTDFLIANDFFGYVMTLNLNKEGYTHRTAFGGFMSFIFKVALGLFFI